MQEEYAFNYKEFTVPFEELQLERPLSESPQFSGFPLEYINEIVAVIFKELPWRLKPRAGYYQIRPSEVKFKNDYIVCMGQKLTVKPTIFSRVKKSQSICLFVVTIGSGLEEWARELIEKGEYLEGYIIDWLASEFTERAAQWIEKIIEVHAASHSMKITSRYSPGYCGWNLSDQHVLFSILPQDFCGIKLTDSSLMLPLKSISGIIGIGKNVNREPYNCSACEMVNCFRRQ